MILALTMLLALAACGSTPAQISTETQEPAPQEETSAPQEETPAAEEPAEETAKTVNVTFDYNYDGAPESLVIEVEAGGVIYPHNEENPNSAPPKLRYARATASPDGTPRGSPCWKMATPPRCGLWMTIT